MPASNALSTDPALYVNNTAIPSRIHGASRSCRQRSMTGNDVVSLEKYHAKIPHCNRVTSWGEGGGGGGGYSYLLSWGHLLTIVRTVAGSYSGGVASREQLVNRILMTCQSHSHPHTITLRHNQMAPFKTVLICKSFFKSNRHFLPPTEEAEVTTRTSHKRSQTIMQSDKTEIRPRSL